MMRGWGDLMLGGVGGGGYNNMMMPNTGRRFEEQYHCYSVAYADKAHLEKGDKILLPPSAFDTLARLQVDYPMLFRLSVGSEANNQSQQQQQQQPQYRRTHCGVLEFTAEEGCCYIPFWMMQNLLIEEGTLITVTNVSLPKATFVKLQPQSVDFLEISNPRAVLEHALRNFSCVTLDDIIQIPYNNKNYHFALKEVNPSPAACIIETDCNVDFDAPVGYQEPERPLSTANNSRRSSACPSPATTATSLTAGGDGNISTTGIDDDPMQQQTSAASRTRIVNGVIIHPDDYDVQQRQPNSSNSLPSMLAEKSGSTGVQRNAAIAEPAPAVDYWAIQAGDGARLDGKQPAPLKDAMGNVVDIRKIRAEAAQRRAEQEAKDVAAKLPASGKTVSGETVDANATAMVDSTTTTTSFTAPEPLVSKRKKIVGSKYSKLKNSSAFGGNANNL